MSLIQEAHPFLPQLKGVLAALQLLSIMCVSQFASLYVICVLPISSYALIKM